MKNTLRIVTLLVMLQASSVFAASSAESGGIGIIGWLFIGFMAVIVAFQFIPSAMMFGSMMAGLFGKTKKHEEVLNNGKVNNS
ncbi:MAG: hypothetical protein J7L25_11750 [Deltaproteobacteria bacterium]|nr:hypothetical protein [Candidatus Tharpella aukensis]